MHPAHQHTHSRIPHNQTPFASSWPDTTSGILTSPLWKLIKKSLAQTTNVNPESLNLKHLTQILNSPTRPIPQIQTPYLQSSPFTASSKPDPHSAPKILEHANTEAPKQAKKKRRNWTAGENVKHLCVDALICLLSELM